MIVLVAYSREEAINWLMSNIVVITSDESINKARGIHIDSMHIIGKPNVSINTINTIRANMK